MITDSPLLWSYSFRIRVVARIHRVLEHSDEVFWFRDSTILTPKEEGYRFATSSA
jgi:hypothetical protein